MLRVLTLSTLFPDAARPNFGVFVERQTRGLAAHPDIDLRVVAPIGVPPWPADRLRHGRFRDVPTREAWRGVPIERPRFLAVPATGGRYHARLLTRALVPVLDAIRADFAFDVIDVSFFFPDGPAAIALGRRYDVPVSIKARGFDIHHWGHNRATAAQVRRAGQAAGGLLAVSDAMKADMVAIGLSPARIRVHYTGVDRDAFVPRDRAAAKAAWGVGGPLVTTVGALIPRKGHDITIDAVARVPGVTLLIAGEGPERARLEAQIARLGVGDRVRLLGAIANGDLPRLFAAADVMALASSAEGLANVWIESLASGTPLVITDSGGAREVVTSPAAGRIVARTSEAFAVAIAAFLASPPDPADVRRCAERFTWAANTEALYAHLAGLVRQRSSG